ncbi:MAG TPA: CBS domain-containing protein [Ktedonobacteraceae bacterium]|nr:CBS domain-containing protein [Ktedonobacteraceae bacterium]
MPRWRIATPLLATNYGPNRPSFLALPKRGKLSIMTSGFVAVPETATHAETIRAFVNTGNAEHQFYIYTLDEQGALSGVLDLRQLLSATPTTLVRDLTIPPEFSVPPDMDQEQVAHLFARYDLLALPAVKPNTRKLLGVITAHLEVLGLRLHADLWSLRNGLPRRGRH